MDLSRQEKHRLEDDWELRSKENIWA